MNSKASKTKPTVARNAREVAKVLGLAPADGMEIERL
jgi:hypothetical protein